MLFWLSDDRPHSSSDPFGATFPPGEGLGAAAPFAILRLALLAQDNKTGAAVHIHFRICHFQYLDNIMKEL